MSFRSGRKWQKSPVLSSHVDFFLNLQGEILHKYIILYSCCQWKQKILIKVSVWMVSVEIAVPKTFHDWKKKQTPSSVEWF